MSGLFIGDGYDHVKSIDAVPGLFPDLKIVYRAAAFTERARISFATTAKATGEAENEVIVKHVQTINGEAITAANVGKLVPSIRIHCLNAILGYVGSDEENDSLKN